MNFTIRRFNFVEKHSKVLKSYIGKIYCYLFAKKIIENHEKINILRSLPKILIKKIKSKKLLLCFKISIEMPIKFTTSDIVMNILHTDMTISISS